MFHLCALRGCKGESQFRFTQRSIRTKWGTQREGGRTRKRKTSTEKRRAAGGRRKGKGENKSEIERAIQSHA